MPIISGHILDYLTFAIEIAHEFWKDVDDGLDPIQAFFYKVWLSFLTVTPDWMDNIIGSAVVLFNKVPWETWESVPRILVNSILALIAVPFALNQVEQFYKRAAHKNEVVGKKAKND